MELIDSHTHLFDEAFQNDLPEVIQRAKDAGITHVFMPNIDSTTIDALLKTCEEYKGYCFPMAGLHPTSVKEDYKTELEVVEHELRTRKGYVAVGEIGMDLYWDKTFLHEQIDAFEQQIRWAMNFDLPIVIHCREAFAYVYDVVKPYAEKGLRGVFHSFTGTADEALKILEFPQFMIGINGVVTFKKSTLPIVLQNIPLERLVLETDSPYLAPVPNRGKRNESSFMVNTMLKVADVKEVSPEIVAKQTTINAFKLFFEGESAKNMLF